MEDILLRDISAPRRKGTPPLLFGTRRLSRPNNIPTQFPQVAFIMKTETSEQSTKYQSQPPRLCRLSHLSIDESIKLQKQVSRRWLVIFFLPFPMLLLFGHGHLDAVADWSTNGNVTSFGQQEKNVALCLGYTLITLWMSFLVMAIVFLWRCLRI